MRAFAAIGTALVSQRGHLMPWTPVCLGIGIGLYFAWPREPGAALLWGLAVASVLLCAAAWRGHPALSPLLWALALVAAGVPLAAMRAERVAGPVLGFRYYGPIEGSILRIDRSASDALRLTLGGVVLERVAPRKTPLKVRISLHGRQGFISPEPGMRVMLTGHLSPPSGPAEPGGFDFQRHAWFQQLGTVGYTRTPVLQLAPAPPGVTLYGVRMALSRRIQAALPGQVGAFAAAVTTGDRGGIEQSTIKALRASNLAHLLAISGLHMGLLAGFVFAALRILVALIPPLALRIDAKRIAAIGALCAAAAYLALSGGNVATQRAFVMAAVALIAVVADRRVLSLRAVAVAACIVLILRPESLLGPGFQMSFAATVALVAVFGLIRDRHWSLGPRWLGPVTAVVISSAVAGAATAPYGAAHFNQIAVFGLPANLAAVPMMGTVVIPAAVLAALLGLIGLSGLGLAIMGVGLNWILGVAHFFAEMDGATRPILAPDWQFLPLFSLGALILILWRGRARWAGLAPVAASVLLWAQTDRPAALIDDSGRLVGVMTPEGRALSKPRGQGFVAGIWLENDGDGVDQKAAFARWPGSVAARVAQTGFGSAQGPRLIHVQSEKAAEGFDGCDKGDIVVIAARFARDLPCNVIDAGLLSTTGAIALMAEGDGFRIVTARDHTGTRRWNKAPQKRR